MQLAELRSKLTAARFVSLVGPGGVGKSRLAMRFGAAVGRRFRDGVWLVEAGEIRDSRLLGNIALAALDLRDQSATEPLDLVLTYLRDKELLLVLDNCEHLLEAAARLVAAVLKAAPDVRVIVTSREPLAVPGEHVIPVPPLDLPQADAAPPLNRLRQNEAVMLFIERAGAASGKFELTHDNQTAVVDLCRRLDGLPLALELAAVRTRVLTAEAILERLNDRFGLLAGASRMALPRHQTLKATIDWSHELLADDERTLLRRLSAFGGLFTLEDVEAVCTLDGAPAARVLDDLTSLVEKSLVIKEGARKLGCYRLHETMREYARMKLREAGEEEVVEAWRAEYFGSKGRRPTESARSGLVEWLEWMDIEIDNIRAVLRQRLTRGEFSHGIDLAVSLGWYWCTRATTEGARWLDELLASAPPDPGGQAWAYFMRGYLAVLMADRLAAKEALKRAIAAATETGQLPLRLMVCLGRSRYCSSRSSRRSCRLGPELSQSVMACH